ncbi:hypothetical protein [Pseudomonas sp. WS 5051]|uniref:hypothetical protein n=1 Tax=Pseudomonas sp. WS 5051 TaxID=2717482 RepID=UPI0014755964|nr:hypothetical protein [Pseudomonas sp. WS 5051]NMY54173.1 hypothetical protein [Pseudomonas sp. WS 5051]
MGHACCGNGHLLMACSLSALLGWCAVVHGASNGEIVLTRTVQPHAVGNPPMHPDPDPLTVNASPLAQVMGATRELSDGDFASVSSGTAITRSILPSGNTLPGLTTSNGLPGISNGHAGGSANSISGTIGNSISQGMRPLSALGQGK